MTSGSVQGGVPASDPIATPIGTKAATISNPSNGAAALSAATAVHASDTAPGTRITRQEQKRREQQKTATLDRLEDPDHEAALLDRRRSIQYYLWVWASKTSMTQRALITGITGQDGSYLAELLLAKGYEVFGVVAALERAEPLAHRAPARPHRAAPGRPARSAVARSASSSECKPHEVYNLAAMSFVPASWDQPMLTGEYNSQGVTRMLEAIRQVDPKIRLYQASSSEMYGKVREVPQTRADAVLSAQPVRRVEGVRPLHHRQLPRELRPVRRAPASCSTTSRRGAAWSSSPAR